MAIVFSGAKCPRTTELLLLHKNYRFTEVCGDSLWKHRDYGCLFLKPISSPTEI